MTRTLFSRPVRLNTSADPSSGPGGGRGRRATDVARADSSAADLGADLRVADLDPLEGQLAIDLRTEPPVLVLDGVYVAPLPSDPPSLTSRVAVRTVDLMIAVPAFVLAVPLIVLLMIAVRLTSPGPAIFASRRLTREGREFKMWKLRTMVRDGEAVLAAHFIDHPEDELVFFDHMKLERDPRVTPLGRILRKWSLDELPQLWNVIMGHMSIVGPRPLLREEAARLGRVYPTVVRVKGGLTGLWQVSGRSSLSFAQRIPLDVEYVNNRTLRGDAKIVLRTIGQLLRGRPGAF